MSTPCTRRTRSLRLGEGVVGDRGRGLAALSDLEVLFLRSRGHSLRRVGRLGWAPQETVKRFLYRCVSGFLKSDTREAAHGI